MKVIVFTAWECSSVPEVVLLPLLFSAPSLSPLLPPLFILLLPPLARIVHDYKEKCLGRRNTAYPYDDTEDTHDGAEDGQICSGWEGEGTYKGQVSGISWTTRASPCILW